MEDTIEFTFSFEGNDADEHRIDLYDVAQALEGFHRTLALTTHLLLNNEVITQAPSLKNAKIQSLPPVNGSWEITVIISTALYSLATASKETPLGHIIYSAYDYIISESLGVHVDYDKTLLQLYEEANIEKLPKVNQNQLDSVIEKCSNSIKEMHRPIFKTSTATTAKISAKVGNENKALSTVLTMDTYAHIQEDLFKDDKNLMHGYISSYNINTFTGRIYATEVNRPIPFELSHDLQNNPKIIELVVDSLRENALKMKDRKQLKCLVNKIESKTGKLKKYYIVSMSIQEEDE